LHQKSESVGFIALPGCFKKVVFYIVLHLLSNEIGFIALSDNGLKPTNVGFKPLPDLFDFSGLLGLSVFSGFLIKIKRGCLVPFS
jgi:hypothetical protein